MDLWYVCVYGVCLMCACLVSVFVRDEVECVYTYTCMVFVYLHWGPGDVSLDTFRGSV